MKMIEFNIYLAACSYNLKDDVLIFFLAIFFSPIKRPELGSSSWSYVGKQIFISSTYNILAAITENSFIANLADELLTFRDNVNDGRARWRLASAAAISASSYIIYH